MGIFSGPAISTMSFTGLPLTTFARTATTSSGLEKPEDGRVSKEGE
jgi:hypothetical protein